MDGGRFADSTRLPMSGPFSRNGERVAFVSDRNGWARVWVANGEDRSPKPVTTLKATELVIGSWSRDGQGLLSMRRSTGTPMSTSWHLDGRAPRRLTTEPSFDRLAEWSG